MHDAVSPEELAKWNRWFGVECNNTAWRLAEQSHRTQAEDAQMLNSAHAAALHWSKVGTDVHKARATMLLGHVHALLGHAPIARAYAAEAFDFIASHDSPAWEVAFAHLVLANAASCAGDSAAHAKHFAIATDLGKQLSPADRAVFEATYRVVPPPRDEVKA